MTNRKRCPRCVKLLPLTKFKQVNGKPRGYCYPCALAYYHSYNKKRYSSPQARAAELARGRKKYREQIRPFRIARRIKLVTMFGGKCRRCGYNKNAAAMDFHHLGQRRKRRSVGVILFANAPNAFEIAVTEARRCELLCANCHRDETYPDYRMPSASLPAKPARPRHHVQVKRHRRGRPGSPQAWTR